MIQASQHRPRTPPRKIPPPRSFRALLALAVLASAPALFAAAGPTSSLPRWQARADRYLERDRIDPPPVGGIVFTGSSSIEKWSSLNSDFPGLPVVGRGLGATWLADVPSFAPRLVYPLRPRIIVVYAGENDLQSGRTVDDVAADFERTRAQIHRQAPHARIVFISIKPSPSRPAILPAVRAANLRLAAACARDPSCRFVDVFTPMLDDRGEPRGELFLADRLHLNAAGYKLWAGLVAPALRDR